MCKNVVPAVPGSCKKAVSKIYEARWNSSLTKLLNEKNTAGVNFKTPWSAL